MFYIFLIWLGLSVSFCQAANILVILPTPSYSHQIAYTHIWKELSLRGHKLTLITTDPLNDPHLINLTEIDIRRTYKYVSNIGHLAENEFTMWTTHHILHDLFITISEDVLTHPRVQDLISNSDKHQFDVVIVEFLHPEFLTFANIYNCPKIEFSTMDTTSIYHRVMGNPTSPSLYTEFGFLSQQPSGFIERVMSTIYTLYVSYYYNYNDYVAKNSIIKKYFNILNTVNELISDIDIIFLNVNPVLQPIRALGPSTIAIGGNRQVVSSTYIPSDLSEYLDSAVEGFIYFSLGGNVKSKDLEKNILNSLVETLGDVPYKVLWKFEADNLPNKPNNVKLIKWAPQQMVLSHPNIKLFITQGGLQSMEEALYREVPCVVIPFFADQDQNAKLMESKGIAVIVNRIPSVKKIELKEAILEVINNPKYRNNVKRLKQLALDFPMSGLEKAIWWTEYVIRNKGAKHLRNPAADIPFYQYYLIDVISFIIVSITVPFWLTYLAIKKVFRFIQLHVHPDKSNLFTKKCK